LRKRQKKYLSLISSRHLNIGWSFSPHFSAFTYYSLLHGHLILVSERFSDAVQLQEADGRVRDHAGPEAGGEEGVQQLNPVRAVKYV
jgi:hypothetical protein